MNVGPEAVGAVGLAAAVVTAAFFWPRRPAWAGCAWVVAGASIYVVLWRHPGPWAVVCGFMGPTWTLRAFDIARWGRGLSRPAYLHYVLDPTRPALPAQVDPPSRSVQWRTFWRGALLAGAAAASIACARRLRLWEVHPLLDDLVFALEGCLAFTAFADTVTALCWRLGRRTAPPHDPWFLLAPSVRSFWGNRWNRFTAGMLRRAVFRPVGGRRHPARGVLLTFLASGMVHGCPQLLMAGPPRVVVSLAAAAFAFFLLHGIAVLVELRARRWLRGVRARVFTYAVFALTLPLYPTALGLALTVHGRPPETALLVRLAGGGARPPAMAVARSGLFVSRRVPARGDRPSPWSNPQHRS